MLDICEYQNGYRTRTGRGRWECKLQYIDDAGTVTDVDIVGRESSTSGTTYIVAGSNQSDWYARRVFEAILADDGMRTRAFGLADMRIVDDPDIGTCAIGTYTSAGDIWRYALA